MTEEKKETISKAVLKLCGLIILTCIVLKIVGVWDWDVLTVAILSILYTTVIELFSFIRKIIKQKKENKNGRS